MEYCLDSLLDSLRSEVTDPLDYSGELHEVAFELVTADTFVAGIATTLVDGEKVDPAHYVVVRTPFLEGTSWVHRNGSRVELREHQALLKHARCVEEVRRECARLLGIK